MLKMSLDSNQSANMMLNSLKTTNWVKTHSKLNSSGQAENLSQFMSNQCSPLKKLSNSTTVVLPDIEFISPSESSCLSEMIEYVAAKNQIASLSESTIGELDVEKFSEITNSRPENICETEAHTLEFVKTTRSEQFVCLPHLILDDQTGEFKESVTSKFSELDSNLTQSCGTLTSDIEICDRERTWKKPVLQFVSDDDSGSEYIPSSIDESSSEETENESNGNKRRKQDLRCTPQVGNSKVCRPILVASRNDKKVDDQLEIVDRRQEIRTGVEEKEKINVLLNSNTDCIRRYDKKPYCFYCGIPQSKIVRHWFAKHKTENAVIQISVAEKHERVKLILRLRNIGNHLHNCEVLKEGKGELLVSYRKRKNSSPDDYLPCESCFAYLHRNELYRHRCRIRGKSKGRVIKNAELLLPASCDMTTDVHKIINSMVGSEVRLIVRNDVIIRKFTLKLSQRHTFERRGYVRAKVREIARFLLEMRKKNPTLSLKDCINPALFRDAIECVKSLSGYDSKTGTHKAPSLALKIGHSLKKCAKLVKAEAIISDDRKAMKAADKFFELCDLEWNDAVSFTALQTLSERKRSKVNLLPLSSDVMKLHNFLKDEMSKQMQQLKTVSQNKDINWRYLAEAILTQIICFNRRRQGEVSAMKITDYNNKTTSDLAADVQQSLGALEQNLCKIFTRIEIRGKRGRSVPVLILASTQEAIDLLTKTRQEAGIPDDNPYVFAYSNSDNHLRGSDCLRKLSSQCGAEYPERLRSTNLRKHVATMCQVLNMKENEMDLLAQFMGHDIRVHRQFYRLPDNTLQVAVLAKIFMMMEDGTIMNQCGKALNEILIQGSGENIGKLFCNDNKKFCQNQL